MSIFCLFFMTAFSALAENSVYPPQRLPSLGIARIQIVGVKGVLKLRHVESRDFSLRVSHTRKSASLDDWHLSVERQGDTLVIEVFSVAQGKQWQQMLTGEAIPMFNIDLSGPSRPVTVAWREGDLLVEKWRSSIEASFLRGNVVMRQTVGSARLQVVNGFVHVVDHLGPLALKGEAGRVRLRRVQGDLNLNWVRGEMDIQNLHGNSAIAAQHAQLQLVGSKGHLKVDLQSGRAQLRRVASSLVAQGQTAHWQVEPMAGAQVQLRAHLGGAELLGASSRARVLLTTKTGVLKVRQPSRISERNGMRILDWQPKNAATQSVYISSQSGSIRWL